MAEGPTGPLRGVRIVDLTQALAGPFCTMLLADLGAEVIKVEPPSGDHTRYGGPFTDDDDQRYYGGYFASINRNKLGVVLDLKDPADRDRLLELVDTADAVVENYRAGVMDRLGLSYETLAERNPRLVYAAIRGFGDPRSGTSPYVDWPAYDVVAQAMSGVVAMTGTAEGQVLRVGPSVGDLYPATMTALGITAALFEARASGQGQFLDVAMVDALVALAEASVYRYSYWGRVDRPTGNSHPQLSPFDIFPTADGHCAIAAPTETHWPTLCQVMGRPDLIDDDRTRTNRDRHANRALVTQVVIDWTTARTTAEIVEALGGRVPVGPVHTNADLYADPHLKARQMLVAIEHPGAGRPTVFPNNPIRYSRTPTGVYRRAPLLGEHSDQILSPNESEADA